MVVFAMVQIARTADHSNQKSAYVAWIARRLCIRRVTKPVPQTIYSR